MENTRKLVLGEKVNYPKNYDSTLLMPISRSLSRESILYNHTEFSGNDLWTVYEASHLDLNGKAVNLILSIEYSQSSESIIESKSLKLYFNGFNFVKDLSSNILKTIQTDLSTALNLPVNVLLIKPVTKLKYTNKKIDCVDSIQTHISEYSYNKNLLKTFKASSKRQYLCSHLLRSNCPVTGQPDWGSVYIALDSKEHLDKESFLKYIMSFREHQEFHEQCVERIIVDLKNICKPSSIVVFARFTRRGGIDINPYRVYGTDIYKKIYKQMRLLQFKDERQ